MDYVIRVQDNNTQLKGTVVGVDRSLDASQTYLIVQQDNGVEVKDIISRYTMIDLHCTGRPVAVILCPTYEKV